MADIIKISVNGTSYDLKDNTKSAVSLNGSWRIGVNSAVFYAPTSAGDTGQILISGGSSGAPTWSTPVSIAAVAPLTYTVSNNTAVLGAVFDTEPTSDSTNFVSSGGIYSACVLKSNVSASNPTLSWATTSTLGTVGGVTFKVTMPSSIYVSANNTTSAYLYYPTFVTNNSSAVGTVTGSRSAYVSSKIYYVPSSGTLTSTIFNTTSDARLKENIVEYKCDNSILNLPIYKYDFIDGAKNQIGCLAQDLQKICPELVTEGDKGYLAITESKIVYLLLQELKVQSERIEKLESVLAEMEK